MVIYETLSTAYSLRLCESFFSLYNLIMNNLNKRLQENQLRNKEDLRRCLCDLLSPLKKHAVGGGLDLGSAAAHYSPRIALMEGWSRTLWGIGPLIAGGGKYPEIDLWLSILCDGVNPGSQRFWGMPVSRDQRMVEMAAIALSLIIAKETFWEGLDKTEQERLYVWLSAIQEQELPPTNWHFFRILVCLAFRELGLPVKEQAEEESFNIVESCYKDEGWYADGVDGAYDLYNPMGFHFYGLVYARLAGSWNPERAARYKERAKLFAPRFAQWFRDDGSVVPYGRSLCYRFAAHSFFSACAFAGAEALPWGIMKRIVLQGLRYWLSSPILDNGGILSVGYGYPNLIMADHYNSPGSPYWGLKAFLVLALNENHPFWQAEETPLPNQPQVTADKIPCFIVSRNADDAQLLCPGRKPPFEMNHAAQKYCKFAYSARFGFCVSHGGASLEQAGGDSTLLLSEIDSETEAGEEHWRERGATTENLLGENWISGVWRPWPDVKIFTLLVSLGDWHLRVHRIESARKLKTAEGAFPVKRYNGFDEALPLRNSAAENREALAAFPWGASRIAALEPLCARTGILVVPAPNLNVLESSAVIPTLTGTLEIGTSLLVTAVRAGTRNAVIEAPLPFIAINEVGLKISYKEREQTIPMNGKLAIM
jgi:hypothetical protein